MVNKPPPDFKRKKVKVGRKVKRENVTKISLSAKKVHVPLQQLDASRSLESEDARVSQISKQLHHFSSTNRVGALHELRQIFGRGLYTVKHIAIVLPSAMELLFDVEKDTRQALKDLVAYLVQYFDTPSFMSIRNIIVTYCCSGLTHLDKNIRVDALHIIQHFVPTSIFQNDIEKIISHILTLLHDRDILSNITVATKKPPLLVLCLQVISGVLKPTAVTSGMSRPSISPATSSVYFINGINSCNVSSHAPLASSTCISLLTRFQYFWNSLTLGDTSVSHNNIQLLNMVITIIAQLTQHAVFTQQVEFASLMLVVLRTFPYRCTEVQQSINISISNRQLLVVLQNFNLGICSLFYQYATANPMEKVMESVNVVQMYVKSLLHDMVSDEEESDPAKLFTTLRMQIAYDIQHEISANTVIILRDIMPLLQSTTSSVLQVRIIDTVRDVYSNDFLFSELSQHHNHDIYEIGKLLSDLPLLGDMEESTVYDVLHLVLLSLQRQSDIVFDTIPRYFTDTVYGKYSTCRMLLLSIFYYVSNDNLHTVARDVCSCVAKYWCLEHATLLMKLLYSRRTEIQLNQFLQLSIDFYMLCVKNTPSAQLDSLYVVATSPLHITARLITDMYHWCSSNVSPLQLLQVLQPLLKKMAQVAVKKWEAHGRMYAVLTFVQTLAVYYMRYITNSATDNIAALVETFSSLLAVCTIYGAEGGVINQRLQHKLPTDLTHIVRLLAEPVMGEKRVSFYFFKECELTFSKSNKESQIHMLKHLHAFLFSVKQYEYYSAVFEDAANMLRLLKNVNKSECTQVNDILKFIE